MYNFQKKTAHNSGFTLIEMIIALSIFVLIVLMVGDIFVVINHSQRRVANLQKLQDDVRYSLEAMAQEIRLGRINYDYYVTENIDLHPESAVIDYPLAVINQSGEFVYYRKNGNNLEFCKNDAPTDCPDWQVVTPVGVIVAELRFIITPSADPFFAVIEQSCTSDVECDADYNSYRCDTGQGRCEYFSDGGNFQPKVRIIMKSEGTSDLLAGQVRISMQTLVSSRLINGKVQNLFYD
jgi:prepilin-type N-terminal cleavage/methylation domain-containing protein